jgi:drug/metabolite transporter (DMT)-like permease
MMIALLLGLIAALGWSCHDLLARHFAARLGPYRMAYWVMLAGAGLLLFPVLWRNTLWSAPSEAVGLALAMGVVYAVAAAGLFFALTLAPVSIVGPIVGGYPALVVLWGLINGLQPTILQWFCIAIILLGVIVVARAEQEGQGHSDVLPGKLSLVLIAATVSSIGYAATAVMGQQATAGLGAWETTFVSRFPAAAVLLVAVMTQGRPSGPIPAQGWLGIVGMAAFDVGAVTAINMSAYFPNKELGAMAISASSATSVLLAMAVLKEKVTAMQWFGVVMIVAGVAGLAAPV